MTAFVFQTADAQSNVAPIDFKISNLSVSSLGPDPDSILKLDEAFELSVDLEFVGSGAAALVAAELPVKVTFYAESIGPGAEVTLGSTTIETKCNQLKYTVTLKVASPKTVKMDPELLYKIAAIVRVGATYCPALINGFISAVGLQVYSP